MNVVSLFSGAGGFDLGFVQAGHNIVWANDNDPDCAATYRANINDHLMLADVSEIAGDQIPDADVLIGGFPCQGFSRANLRRSRDDERNRLYLEFVRILGVKMPSYFVAENVRGLLSLDDGRVAEMVFHDFRDVGYRVEHRVINMADYGVPQTRRRVIILGTRQDLTKELDVSFPSPTHSNKPSLFGRRRWVSISAALEGIPEPDDAHELKNHVCSQYKVTNRDFTGHRRTDPTKPSPTILARGNGGGGVCALHHPMNHRRLSVRESATIQTFPLEFEFFGSLNSMYRQVGNAVPPLFARRLAEEFVRVEELAGEGVAA